MGGSGAPAIFLFKDINKVDPSAPGGKILNMGSF
jgi:hypothetical protein